MIAYLDYEDDCCPSCGLLREECQDKAAQFSFEAAPIRCHVTLTRELAADEFAKAKGDTRGLMFGIRRRSLEVSTSGR